MASLSDGGFYANETVVVSIMNTTPVLSLGDGVVLTRLELIESGHS